jgi:hypothetical protein
VYLLLGHLGILSLFSEKRLGEILCHGEITEKSDLSKELSGKT